MFKIVLTCALLLMITSGCAKDGIDSDISPRDSALLELNDETFPETAQQPIIESIPEASALLSSLIVFQHDYAKVEIAKNVEDVIMDGDVFAFLTNDMLYTNLQDCSSLLLHSKYKKLIMDFPYVGAYDSETLQVFDLNECAELSVRVLRTENFNLAGGVLAFWQDNKIYLHHPGLFETYDVLQMPGTVLAVGASLAENSLRGIDDQGNLLEYSVLKKELITASKTSLSLRKASISEDFIYIMTEGGDIAVDKHGYLDVKNNAQQCIMSRNKNHIMCNGTVYDGNGNSYEFSTNPDIFVVGDYVIYYVSNYTLYAAKFQKIYYKKIRLNFTLDMGCYSGTTYHFTDLDDIGKSIKISDGTTANNCLPISFDRGNIIDKSGNLLYEFAKIFDENERATAYVRHIDEDFYYFFEPK